MTSIMYNWSTAVANVYRAASRFAASQWETSLQSNAVSHWLGANQPRSSPGIPIYQDTARCVWMIPEYLILPCVSILQVGTETYRWYHEEISTIPQIVHWVCQGLFKSRGLSREVRKTVYGICCCIERNKGRKQRILLRLWVYVCWVMKM